MNPLGASAGLWMLLALGALTISTGLPVWSLLLAVATMFASIGWATGVLDGNILGAMPVRLVGLLESDLLQALPLYVLVGMLLQRLEIADAMFRTLESWLRRTGSGQSLAALALGALIAPMNGSVASSSALLTRLVVPRLHAMDGARATALVSASATIGVIVPPSLVLLLLGDAMLRAHTEATNLPGFSLSQRIINTQDVFHAALLPGCAILALWALCVHWTTPDRHPAPDKIGRKQTAPAVAAMLAILALLGAVFTGRIFPVEAAATGALLLTASALFFPQP
jgi:TRAP-type mannitol/chloroaromatic compound transport system permease large subunit